MYGVFDGVVQRECFFLDTSRDILKVELYFCLLVCSLHGQTLAGVQTAELSDEARFVGGNEGNLPASADKKNQRNFFSTQTRLTSHSAWDRRSPSVEELSRTEVSCPEAEAESSPPASLRQPGTSRCWDWPPCREIDSKVHSASQLC